MPIAWCVPELSSKGAQRETATSEYLPSCPRGLRCMVCVRFHRTAGHPGPECPWKGLSRVKGNFHARFLGGCERATAHTYPVPLHALMNWKLFLLLLCLIAWSDGHAQGQVYFGESAYFGPNQILERD